MRTNRRVLLAVPAAVAVVAGLAGDVADGPADTWQQRTDALIVRAMAAADGDEQVIGVGSLVVALGQRRGFDHPDTSRYLHKLLSLQHADGGFGAGESWDTWQDGSFNAASTAYTVSMADHAWPALRDAIRAGVTYAPVEQAAQRMLAKLWAIPTVAVRPGYCLAYSDSPYDDDPYGYCVHNVNAGAAKTLVEAWRMGLGPRDPSWVAAGVTQATAGFANRTHRGWTYSTGSGKIQDPAHNAYTIESMLTLAPGIGDNFALINLMGRPTNLAHWAWPLAHVYLAGHPSGDYCGWLDDYAAEFDAYTASFDAGDFPLLAQAAWKAAIAARTCE